MTGRDSTDAFMLGLVLAFNDPKDEMWLIQQLEARKPEHRQADRGRYGRTATHSTIAAAVIDSRPAEWRRPIRQSTTQARSVIQRTLRGRITLTPRSDGQGYDFEAHTRLDKMFNGVATPRSATAVRVDKRGWENLTAEDTLDADYGTLLDSCLR